MRQSIARYRPKGQRKSPYITLEGHENLKKESETLWKKRRACVQALSAAAAEGDRSENAEYIYRKKELREIDYRLRYLKKRLPDLKIVDQPPANPNNIYFGAWVTLADEEDRETTYRIVGPDEFDQDDRYISMDSPVAKALLGKTLDDEVEVQTPAGVKYFDVIAVWY